MNGQAAGDLWHLTIDDLLAAPADAPRLQGPGPFVINLSASTAPIEVPAAGLKGYEQLLLYQLKQTEDGRTRFRLRLGPIASELEADAILSALREHYPSAFATNAAEDDLKVFERKAARTAEATTPAPKAQPAAPAVALDAAGEVEAEIELPPAKPATHAGKGVPGKTDPATKATKPAPHTPKGANGAKTAAPGAGGTAPVEDSAEFAIDFDAFLPPMDLPAQATAPSTAPLAGSAKRKKREHKSTRHPKVARPEVAKAAKPEGVKGARPAAKAVAVPTPPEPTVAERPEPTKFVEPAPDPNAVTDQVAVLAVPAVGGELTLDDAVESMIVPALSDAPEHDLDMSGVVPALQVEVREDHDLASVVAKNNAMVEALQARNDQPAQTDGTAPETVPAAAVDAAPASALPVTTPAVPPTADVLAAIAAAPTVKDVQAVEATAILQVEAPADIEADVDDFTSTIVGVEGEQEIEALLEPTLVPVPSEALAQVSSEPEPPELVEVVEPRRTVRRSEPPVAEVAEQAEPVTLTEAVEIKRRAPVPAAARPAVAEPAIKVPAVDVVAVEGPAVQVPAVQVPATEVAAREVSAPEAEVVDASAVAPVAELTLVPDEPPAAQNAVQPEIADSVVELASLEDRLPAETPPEASVALPHADIVEVLEVVEVSSLPESGVREPAPAAPKRTESAIEPATAMQAPKVAKVLAEPLPEVDSTQTIRELTPLELADDQASQYFAIQLSLSDEAVNQDEVPHLDIFDAYRLYCVAGMHQGTFKHALRLGFFSDAGSAGAVAGYLRCYFESPEVTRVANAERERFSQQRVVPKRDIGATATHTIIELSTAARVPERRLAEISNNPSHRASDSGSLWSRLVAPLKR